MTSLGLEGVRGNAPRTSKIRAKLLTDTDTDHCPSDFEGEGVFASAFVEEILDGFRTE
jgi:hypothetical protein